MPEYLAPGVYVEEIDSGSKPIEGVSTSTAGMIGVTERGPVNVPILVTSFGEFTRWFGGYLNPLDFGGHCYLPHAVEGFFTNGGKRLFFVRVLDTAGATQASFDLHNRGTSTSALTMLLRSASERTGDLSAPIYVMNVNSAMPGTGSLANGDRLRIGDGSDAEYRVVAEVSVAATHLPLNFPLRRFHDSAVTVHDINRVLAAGPNTFTLFADADAGTASIDVTVAAVGDISANDLLEIGGTVSGEHRFAVGVTGLDSTHVRVILDAALWAAHGTAESVFKLNPVPGVANEIANSTLAAAANAADDVVFLTALGTAFVAPDQLVVFDRLNNSTREARRIGRLSLLALSTGAYGAYPVGTLIQGVNLADDTAVTPKQVSTEAVAGTTVLSLDDRVDLAVNDVLRIGVAPNQEYATVVAIPNPSPGGAAPNRGNIIMAHPLNNDFQRATEVRRQKPPTVRADRPATRVVLDVAAGRTFLPVADGGTTPTRYSESDFIRVTASEEDVSYHLLTADADVLLARPITLTVPLSRPHSAGAPVAERGPLLEVHALDPGAWGNRLLVSVEDESPGLMARTALNQFGPPTRIRLASAAGVEAGTILELLATGTDNAVGSPLKVAAVNRATGDITLDAALDAAQQAAHTAAVGAGQRLGVRSREFSLTVRLLRQPDAAVANRAESVLDLERFRFLSMDPRHSRYVETVIGVTWVLGETQDAAGRPLRLADRRSEGESHYIRVFDVGRDATGAGEPLATLHGIRLGPEPLVDILPDNRERAARHALTEGDDSIETLNDNTYIGTDDPEPLLRTGLFSLRNEEDISIVACPGRTTATVQGALINHCELMRYRFAVLDAQRPPQDSLSDVQNQRQQFDTKYAALYHPWPLIADPFPVNLAEVADYAVPPSGHVIGIYARTDTDRGVHKAPANEVVRGVIGLRRLLNKGEQDILNPFPVNINVIRDFRPNNRGIRVFGGRVITSDPDWKYVNVRRLLIFIEASIDRGLQWVVFEPNAEPLWARVYRTVSNFLSSVWRDGALEGTKPEEAYFVKVDRTTMTQTDIDNGKLIVVIGVAPVKPAEFVIIRIGLWTAHADT